MVKYQQIMGEILPGRKWLRNVFPGSETTFQALAIGEITIFG
jgi:hypothetical protein